MAYIVYYIKGDDKPFVWKGSLKKWKEKVKKLDSVTKWHQEKR